MTENNKNRFTDNETNCLIDSSFTDNLTKKIYVIDEWERIIGLCNNLWEQTQRFEKENQRLNTEIEQLKQQNKELKSDNDIKFWKLQCIRFSNGNGIILHEISRAIEEGYEVSNEFKQYLHDLKVQNEKNVEKAKRLGI